MQSISPDPSLFQGAVSLQQEADWISPWRLPWSQRRLFPTPDDGLLAAAHHASGVRLRFETDTRNLAVTLHALPHIPPLDEAVSVHLDLVIDNDLVQSVPVTAWDQTIEIDGLPEGTNVAEVWLPQNGPVAIRELLIDDGATVSAAPDPRKKWVTYGSSLTHCTRAHSPARTWPAIVARRHNLHLTSLGFGGQCCLDPMVARTLRELPADCFTLKLGINCISGALSARTFPAAVIGVVQVIREKHPDTPIVLVSPIGYPPHETTPNAVGYTISQMREAIADVHQRLVEAGDSNLQYVNGLEVFSVAEINQHTTDECHPEADGIELMAENFNRAVMPLLGFG